MSYNETPIDLLKTCVLELLVNQKDEQGNYKPIANRIFNDYFTANFKKVFPKEKGNGNVEVHSITLENERDHIITSIRFVGNVFSFDPNGKHNLDDHTTMLNTINLHKPNGRGEGECQL